MPNPYFKFKEFTVYQDQCAMKVGTDGVLLGAWADCSSAKSILDIGTGTGLIGLMLAQRSKASIDCLEIDEAAASQASENARNSPWSDRITILKLSFREFWTAQQKKYELIVSNPPYFENALKSPSEERNKARHSDSLSAIEIIQSCKQLLSENGTLALILPIQEGLDCIENAKKEGLFCQQKTSIIPRIGKPAKRLLLSFSFKEQLCTESELLIETDSRHQYSEEYKNLTKDYYLKF